jgi:hypothetical protein
MNLDERAQTLVRLQQSRNFADTLTAEIGRFGLEPVETTAKELTSTSDLRRARRKRIDDPVGVMSLVDEDGILRWQIGNGPAPRGRPGRRSLRRGGQGRIVQQYRFEDLPPNRIGAKLRDLDAFLTPRQGLFEVTSATLKSIQQDIRDGAGGKKIDLGAETQAARTGRILLIVHGTFSNCENVLHELAATPDGRRFLEQAVTGDTYSQVLAFNHPTLSVSPVLNAATLAAHLRSSKAKIDVICHSRGGLVTRWWNEVLDLGRVQDSSRGRIVFVGSPLAGTGLAAPQQLKNALNALTNLSKALEAGAQIGGMLFPIAAPIGQAASVLFSMFGKVMSFAAGSPLLDAGVAMIPGLAAQSREGANGEILHIREAFARLGSNGGRAPLLDSYFFVRANFETEDHGWRFWRNLRKDKVLDVGADVIFEGDNDLVVDSASMTDLVDDLPALNLNPDHIQDFRSTPDVHHLNYFRQAKTVELIRRATGLAA